MNRALATKPIEELMKTLPPKTRQILSEIAVITLNNFVEFHARVGLIADYLTKSNKLSQELISELHQYLENTLKREFVAEDERCHERLLLVEKLAATEKSLQLEELKKLHEAYLKSFDSRLDGKNTLETATSLASFMLKENDSTKHLPGIELVIKFKDDREFKGLIKGGKKNGRGFLKFPNGEYYDGEWKDGERHGQGKYVWKNKSSYEGSYVNNLREGKGTFKFSDGKEYVGDWRAGVRSGKGRLTWPNGDCYEGDFFDSKRTGLGTLK